jgi:hypothetical protein
MSPWLIAIGAYSLLVVATFVPVLLSLLRKVELHNGGGGPEQSPSLSENAKARLQQNHSRLLGALGFWKKEARFYKRFHFYALGWVIASSVLVPFLAQAISKDPYSKWFLTIVAAVSAILLSFHKWIKPEQNYKAFRLGESAYYDLRRRLLDRPSSFGDSEDAQLEAYFLRVEEIRTRVRDAEIDNFPGSEVPRSISPSAGKKGT